MLLASRRFDGSKSRKTKGSLADTLQCSVWRRAQNPGRMTHSFHGGGDHSRGFTVLETTIGTSDSSPRDTAYVVEHEHLQYLHKKIGNYLHDFHRPWFRSFGLPPSNGEHDKLFGSDIRRLMRRVQNVAGDDNRGGRGHKRAGINVFARLDIGHKDFFGKQFINCRPFRSHHKVRMDYVFFIPPPPFYEEPAQSLMSPWKAAGTGAWCSCSASW